jgi:tetratricopeptide (TPR) repeat protein
MLVLVLLVAACFSLATVVQPRAESWSRRGETDGVLKVLLGDGRRLFANQFFVEADVSFHSGYYPSVFDQTPAREERGHLTGDEGASGDEHERKMKFLDPPRDLLERFGRHFLITEHTHLQGGNEREVLPWLKISADLDPQRVETYTVAAYWLRTRLGKVREAESFLREGLRNNPNSYELLFELGRLYSENEHDPARARNVWELALRRWREQEPKKAEPDTLALEQIAINLGRLEEKAGNLGRAVDYLETARAVSPKPEALQQQIEDLKRKMGSGPER